MTVRLSQVYASDRAGHTPFNLVDNETYRRWRDAKLGDYPSSPDQITVSIRDPYALDSVARTVLVESCHRCNMAIYSLIPAALEERQAKSALWALARQMGLTHLDHNLCADEDGIACIRIVPDSTAQEYIPYTNRPIKWHTDGYYNDTTQQIRGLVMYCMSDAVEGGANALLDPEIVYILMRDENPDYIRALMQPNAMTIPANVANGRVVRPDSIGPVFSVHPEDGTLHMRYTARTRSIHWRQDALTLEAVTYLELLLASALPYVLRVRLQPGQGILCNNVLHTREKFSDGPAGIQHRVVLRARYYDRIALDSF